MKSVFLFLAILVVATTGEYLQLYTESDDEPFTATSNFSIPKFESVMNHRSYAYVSAGLIILLFVGLIYCHILSVRKTRLLEQYEQRSTLPEWSPLLNKNIRPPPPYEQVV
ncbi:hypothetical protein GCK72_025301 [Caenorhabditis remanei]|uniref:Uncharacterized protein n=1 Tax=Caenorhabditis remanei TaxID=31234 RepID=A0A6A5G2J0_CAERE|nr:hypothetical protein GCK72_025301 [Caenorhabditis remanei]KAF1748834.1 hypothetical protein GCK72_025301 [Caenorhabditis remanei]